MLKSLHLKNWRSIRDATIEFSPITVLIGANASGKTNILDALYFLRDIRANTLVQAIYSRGGGEKIRNLSSGTGETVSVEYTYALSEYEKAVDRFSMLFENKPLQPLIQRTLNRGIENIINETFHQPPMVDVEILDTTEEKMSDYKNLLLELRTHIRFRWQLLDENFMPPLSAHLGSIGDLYTIEPDARNTVFILDFMKQTQAKLYESLQEDLRFLLSHVSHVDSKRDELEAYFTFHENKYPEKESPTVSAGTARLLAVLAAVYALDMRNPEMSGLVVIEEPETSLNPSLLRKFVELLRSYTENVEKPRQFILTTHNPAFLNSFEPEEVRVVSRDEDGNTVVNPIPDYIREIWLDEHSLGDAWLSNVFGGVAE
jgi:predicted ATPase